MRCSETRSAVPSIAVRFTKHTEISLSADGEVDRAISLVNDMLRSTDRKVANTEALRSTLKMMEIMCDYRFRAPLRDLTATILRYLKDEAARDDPHVVDLALRALTLSGRGMIFFQELFDFLVQQRLSSAQLGVFVYECGRHGLRCKHYLDRVIGNDAPLTMRLSQGDIIRCYKGICKFASDYGKFVETTINGIDFSSLTHNDALVVLRVLKQIGDSRRYTQVISRTDPSDMSLVEKFGYLYLLKKSKKMMFHKRDLLTVEQAVSDLTSLLSNVERSVLVDSLITTDISDGLDAMASWKLNENHTLITNLVSILCDRVAEIRYSPICGLWQAITDSLGHLGHFDGAWMRVVEEMGSSEFSLKSFASFQLVFFTSSLGRLNFFSEKVYRSIANVIAPDIDTIQDLDMLATLLFPMERAAFKCPVLIERVVSQACQVVEKQKTPNRNAVRGALGIAHSATCLGYQDNDKLSRLTSFVFSGCAANASILNKHDLAKLKRLAAVGVADISRVPSCISASPSFTAWGDDRAHAAAVVKTREGFPNALISSSTMPEFADLVLDDGTVVVVDDSPDALMKQWKHPEDDKNHELASVPSSGVREMIRKHLEAQGIRNIQFISP